MYILHYGVSNNFVRRKKGHPSMSPYAKGESQTEIDESIERLLMRAKSKHFCFFLFLSDWHEKEKWQVPHSIQWKKKKEIVWESHLLVRSISLCPSICVHTFRCTFEADEQEILMHNPTKENKVRVKGLEHQNLQLLLVVWVQCTYVICFLKYEY